MICDECFTDSWEPCPESTPNAIKDSATGGYMICGYCWLETQLVKTQVELALLRLTVREARWIVTQDKQEPT